MAAARKLIPRDEGGPERRTVLAAASSKVRRS